MTGTLEQVGDRWRLTFIRRLQHSPEKVWRALTDPEHLKAWFPTDIQGDRAAGAALHFTHRDGAAPPMDGRMIAFEPHALLEFTWGDDDTLRFHLQRDGNGGRLTFVDTFGQLGKAARDAAGWHVCLDALEHHLDGKPDATPMQDRWESEHDRYIEEFGPAAATIGLPAARQ